MGDVTFRRIHGRIVPIRLKKSTQEVAGGAAMVAGGATLALVAGHARRVIDANAFKLYKQGLKQAVASRAANIPRLPVKGQQMAFSFGKKAASSAVQTGALKTSRQMFKIAPRIGDLGRLAGFALIGAGAAKVYQGITKEKSQAKTAAVGTAAAVIAGGTAHAIGLGSKKGIFRIASNLFRKVKLL